MILDHPGIEIEIDVDVDTDVSVAIIFNEDAIGSMEIVNGRWFHSVYVSKEYRNRGYGTIMLRTAMDHCWTNGATTIGLDVERDNVDAIRLYKKLGFVMDETHRDEKYYDMTARSDCENLRTMDQKSD